MNQNQPKPDRPPEDLEAIRQFCRMIDARRRRDPKGAAVARRDLLRAGWSARWVHPADRPGSDTRFTLTENDR